MKRSLLFWIALSIFIVTNAQNKTDYSLFMRADSSAQLTEVSSETGDLYKTIGHHGPAIENEWMALRLYFSEKAAIDVYSKSKAGLELEKARWYPTPEQQKNGWGADYYKAGSTVGLGGVRLWDGDKVVPLNPVSNRSVKVAKDGTTSYMEMLSEGVPYLDRKVDILVRVTVFSGVRNARVEAFALTDLPVQFVTGINYHKGQILEKKEGLVATWGLHPEDVAAESIELGAAFLYQPEDYLETIDDGKQILFISKPAKQLKTWISSANAKEPELNSMKSFLEFLSL